MQYAVLKNLSDAFGEGLENNGKQGLKVFIHGVMTGGIIRIPIK